MFCDFEKVTGGIRCKCCKKGFSGLEPTVQMNCTQECLTQYPTILQMGKNFVTAMVDYAKDGFKNVDDEEKARRLSICKECPFYDGDADRCMSCGCIMSLSSRIASHTCPKGKW